MQHHLLLMIDNAATPKDKLRVRVRMTGKNDIKARTYFDEIAKSIEEKNYLKRVVKNMVKPNNKTTKCSQWPEVEISDTGLTVVPFIGSVGIRPDIERELQGMPIFKSPKFYLPYSAGIYTKKDGSLGLWRLPIDVLLFKAPARPIDGNIANLNLLNWRHCMRQQNRHKSFYIYPESSLGRAASEPDFAYQHNLQTVIPTPDKSTRYLSKRFLTTF